MNEKRLGTALSWLSAFAAVLAMGRGLAIGQTTESTVATTAPSFAGSSAELGEPVGNLLGPEFSDEMYGLAFRPPRDCTEIHKSTPDSIVEFDQEKNHWAVMARQYIPDKAIDLTVHPDQFGHPTDGLLEATVRQIAESTPNAEIIQDAGGSRVFNVGKTRVGAVFVRYSNAQGQRRLLLEAIVEPSDSQHRLFYFLDLIADARGSDADPNVIDPGEKLAYQAFMQMVDSVKPLDRTKIRLDQDGRLLNTRQLFLDWSSMHGQKIRDALVPQQWLRIMKDGKDIGYSLNTEEIDDQVHNPDGTLIPIKNPDEYTLRVNSRTRIFPTADTRWDLGSWLHCSMDRREEIWVTVARGTNAKGAVLSEQQQFGSSREMTKTEMPPAAGPAGGGELGAERPAPSIRTIRTLRITTDVNKIELPPFEQNVAVFYIPQALGSILPRLVPTKQPAQYMFASFVPTPWLEASQTNGGGKVMSRYIDVLPLQEVTLNGQTLHAVLVNDRIARNGSQTTNYLSPEGKFLGSTCTYNAPDESGAEKQTTIITVPSDPETLQRIWTHPEFGTPSQMPKAPGDNGQNH